MDRASAAQVTLSWSSLRLRDRREQFPSAAMLEVFRASEGRDKATYDELIALRRRLSDFDAHACRRRAERYFTHVRMARDYVRMYEHLLEYGRLPAGLPLEGGYTSS